MIIICFWFHLVLLQKQDLASEEIQLQTQMIELCKEVLISFSWSANGEKRKTFEMSGRTNSFRNLSDFCAAFTVQEPTRKTKLAFRVTRKSHVKCPCFLRVFSSIIWQMIRDVEHSTQLSHHLYFILQYIWLKVYFALISALFLAIDFKRYVNNYWNPTPNHDWGGQIKILHPSQSEKLTK